MTKRPRVAVGGIVHETHSFAETPTTLADFKKQSLHVGADLLETMTGTRSGIGGMIDAAIIRGWDLVPTLYAAAMPSGIVSDEAYQTMLTQLLSTLSNALPIDGLLLALHGAMVTENELDVESDILAKVRDVIDNDSPIVVELDMHGNISSRTTELADVLVAFDTNPHIDPYARGQESTAILESLISNEIHPTTAYVAVPIILAPQATGTSGLPLKAVHDRVAAMEAESYVVCISVMAGFAYADTPFTGTSIIVTTDDRPDLARDYAQELADIFLQNYGHALPDFLSPDQAVQQALALTGKPIILVDSADNIGGGTPGDGTDALKAMLAHDVQEGTVVLADAEAVNTCWEVGINKTVTLAVGAKTDKWHGSPITVTGIVKTLSEGIFECELPDNHFAAFYGNTIKMGRSAWLRVQGVNIILTTHKTPPFDLAQLRGIGLIPEEQKMIAVKSAVAYRAAYLPIAAHIIEMDTAGLCSANLSRFPYRHVDSERLKGDKNDAH
ncbi:MAG: M81 family metallopeptidase [Anaerolineae bacterium]|nr:M81 family metallopeptidase [Anaerolineae bacterium]MDQ7037150.1 M81 family metallopeptidase [Anaerolineae bacterium]